MTDKTKEALKLALGALESYKGFIDDAHILEGQWHWIAGTDQAQAAILEALALVNEVDQEESSGTEQPAQQQQIPKSITCPFCESEHVPGWLHDYNMDRNAHGEQPAQHECKFPLCHNEEYQQALAEKVKRELYTGEPAQRKPLTDEEIEKLREKTFVSSFEREEAAVARVREFMRNH